MIEEISLKQLNKQAKRAHKKCQRKIKKALRAKDIICLRMSLAMAQTALRKIELANGAKYKFQK